MAEETLPPAGYEREDVTFGFMLCGAISVLGLILVCTFLVMWLYPSAKQDRRFPSALPAYPVPRLQTDPHADLLRLRAGQMAQLNGTGWIDKGKGIVHIPIDAAMQRIAQQGIPDWPAPAGGKP
jgi:hypothetical protein